MKKNTRKVTAIVCFFFMLAACSKEVDTKGFGDAQDVQTSQRANSTAAISPVINFFKTPFISQINTTTVTDSSILVFDFIEKKNFTKGEKKYLLLPFGDGQFISRGWKYQILIDTTTSAILLSPNDTMKAEIIPGSFKILMATFDLPTKTFNFITRFKELNGNKSEVAETVFKNW